MTDRVYYAIGDIHGEAERLLSLHGKISDYHEARFPRREKTIVHLGDYIDRGPDSCLVVETLMRLSEANPETYINLRGNHEQLAIDAYRSGRSSSFQYWINNGGGETLESYKSYGHEAIPEAQLDWMEALPTRHWDQAANVVFVHAGIDPHNFPDGSDFVHMWTRSQDFFDPNEWKNENLKNVRVIHGHTPTDDNEPDIAGDWQRINIDTGAVYGGTLTAAVVAPDVILHFLTD